MLSHAIIYLATAAILFLTCAAVAIPPDPPLGAIELHHNKTSSSWYMALNLTPETFTDTKGNQTIRVKKNPDKYTNIDMHINITDGGWTIWAVPTSYGGHKIKDPLTEVWIFNTIPVIYDCGTAPIGKINDLLYPAYQSYNDCGTGFPVFHDGAYGFEVSLNKPVSVQDW